MAMVSWNLGAYQKTPAVHVTCRKKERDRDHSYPYKVIEITPPPKSLGIRCFPTLKTLQHVGLGWGGSSETLLSCRSHYCLKEPAMRRERDD
ncbi:hypothetical protein OIU76_019737 [Salix suchowensis]|uniref:Uncharacterized protein n=1 Tax=Salix suchowensis TaxID=1278906 RepID=A0ABQ8ZJJ6_9ROSI|nr:hypothetical protein OIU76_019737 [Salix suchowensis]KAJ6302054.1 hypothetical protein OIU77_016202 [Salix suchowensis]